MVAKHVHATVIAELHRLARQQPRPSGPQQDTEGVLRHSLPRRVEPYLFENGVIRRTAFDFNPLRKLIETAWPGSALTTHIQRVFEQGWLRMAMQLAIPS